MNQTQLDQDQAAIVAAQAALDAANAKYQTDKAEFDQEQQFPVLVVLSDILEAVKQYGSDIENTVAQLVEKAKQYIIGQ